MPDTFGERLRKQREARNLALATIAEQTKIKCALLEALERDDFSQWPAGIFRRSWLRTYATAIGLNPDETVQDFLATHPEPEATGGEGQALQPAPPVPRFRGIVGAALESLRSRRPESEAPVPADRTAVSAPLPGIEPAPDLDAVARICTELGRMESAKDVPPLLEEVARLLGASGVIVWVWDNRTSALRPALVHGYASEVVAKLPPVMRDSHNATAAAFRSGQSRLIAGGDGTSGGLVVPLLIPPRCAGVFAVELPRGAAPGASMAAIATIFAAALAQVVARAKAAQVQARLAAPLDRAHVPPSLSASTGIPSESASH